MTSLNMIFHVVVSVYRLIKIWNSPQFPAEFRNGQLFCARRGQKSEQTYNKELCRVFITIPLY